MNRFTTALAPVLALAIILACILLANRVFAGELDGVNMPDTVEVDGGTLKLNGMAQRSVLWIDVYIAGMYLTEKTSNDQIALNMEGPKKMVMAFQRDVSGEDICDAWKEGFEKNVSEGGPHLMEPLEQLCRDTPAETLEGQTATYTYHAAKDEIVYEIDGETRGSYDGVEFFNALLSCWIGPDPGPGTSFKSDLLSQK